MKFKKENIDYTPYMKGAKVALEETREKAVDIIFPEYENHNILCLSDIIMFKTLFKYYTNYALAIRDFNFVKVLTEIIPKNQDNYFFLRGFADTFNKKIKTNLESDIQNLRLGLIYSEADNREFEAQLLIDRKLQFIAVIKFIEATKIN